MVIKTELKSKIIRVSDRSSNFISPSFGFGCLYNCSYCYMRRHKKEGVNINTNVDEILNVIEDHSKTAKVQKPDQTDNKFITYDISCNEDYALHSKYHDWKKVFNYFKTSKTNKATLATKYIPLNFLNFNPNKKVRIRFSLMPQSYSDILEPNTSKIIDRIKAVDLFIAAGYDVHINFSPVIVRKGWIAEYSNLFSLVNKYIKNKDIVKAEVIFLTHNSSMHKFNLKEGLIENEELLWNPEIQENKVSSYGGINIRYSKKYKGRFIRQFIMLHRSIIPWNTIRYIF